MMRNNNTPLLYFVFMFICAMCVALPALTETDRILAVVNESVITERTLNARVGLIKKTSKNSKTTPAQERVLKVRALNALIEEELIRQYAAQTKLRTTADDMAKAQKLIEQNNTLPAGGYTAFVKGFETAARDQLSAEILLDKITQQLLRRRVQVSVDEIDKLIKLMSATQQTQERDISHIFLRVEDRSDEAAVRERITTLATELENGVDFSQLARTFGEDAAATRGGNIGWLGIGELEQPLEQALTNATVGVPTAPVRGQSGWHILRVNAVREVPAINTTPIRERRLLVLTMRLPDEEKNKDVARKEFKTLAERFVSEQAAVDILKSRQKSTQFTGSGDFGFRSIDTLPDTLADISDRLKVGKASKVQETDNVLTIVFNAGERERLPERLLVLRNRLSDRLYANRLELTQRRFLRDLRKKAYIDIRL